MGQGNPAPNPSPSPSPHPNSNPSPHPSPQQAKAGLPVKPKTAYYLYMATVREATHARMCTESRPCPLNTTLVR